MGDEGSIEGCEVEWHEFLEKFRADNGATKQRMHKVNFDDEYRHDWRMSCFNRWIYSLTKILSALFFTIHFLPRNVNF